MAYTIATYRGDIEEERREHDCLEDAMVYAMEEAEWENTMGVKVFDEDGAYVEEYIGWNWGK